MRGRALTFPGDDKEAAGSLLWTLPEGLVVKKDTRRVRSTIVNNNL